MMPPPPVVEIPEYKLPKVEVPITNSNRKDDKPKKTETPKPVEPKKDETPKPTEPKVEETPKVGDTPKTVEVKQTVYNATPQLPNTGESSTSLLTFVGAFVLGTSMYLLRKSKEEN